ncbi:MAG: ATP-binding protein [Alphaproteobacteria bacterium]|nr:ATP-binding protein [Alphaproteobacteria bacterium]
MLQIRSKPRELITPADIHEVITSRARENESLEFKVDLPTRNGKIDSQTSSKNRISKYAKETLLDESIAFANTHGGVLVVGIKETKGYACAISAIRQCNDVANRLELVFRDRVDPQLPHVEIFGVETRGDAGVVIIRVPKSHCAPHCNKMTHKCTIRRSDRCEPMTMREIQDMTINLSRGLQRVDEDLAKRSSHFKLQVDRFYAPYGVYGIRLTAIPITDEIRIDRLLQGHDLDGRFKLPTFLITRHLDNHTAPVQGINEIYKPHFSLWRPMLRAARTDHTHLAPHAPDVHAATMYKELHFHGLIELGLISADRLVDVNGRSRSERLRREIPIVDFATLALWADQVRAAVGAPLAEYAIEVEFVVKQRPCQVVDTTKDENPVLGQIDVGTITFPRYPLEDVNRLSELLELFERDFLNACGTDLASQQGHLTVDKYDKS